MEAPIMTAKLISCGLIAALVAVAGLHAEDAEPPAPSLLDLVMKTRTARLAGDAQGWLAHGQETLKRAPEHPDLLISVARASAANGRFDEAAEFLAQAIERGAGFDLATFPEFKDAADRAWLKSLAERALVNQQPVSPPEVFLVIKDTRIRPEGITYDAEGGRLLIGSLGGEIWQIDLQGKLSRFAGPDSGLREVLGMKVDAQRGLLWAVSGVFPDLFAPAGESKKDVGLTGVLTFKLETGERVQECWLDERPTLHGFNDLAIAKNGDVYVSDSTANSIYRLPQGECRLERLLQDAAMSFPNGIALAPEEALLYVAHIEGLSAIDPRSGRRTQLAVPTNAAVNSIDGLVVDGVDLLGIQASPYLARIVRIRLGEDGLSVRDVAVVSSRPPTGLSQTTGVVVGSHFYSVAGFPDGLAPAGEAERPSHVLRSSLR
jgi:sugar lactone lactonase YvrE